MNRSDQNKNYTSELVKLSKKNLIAVAYENVEVDSTTGGIILNPPIDVNYALLVLESDVDGTAIRYLETGPKFPVTTVNGIPRSNLDVFDIQGYQNIINFRAIQAQAGTHNLQVQYYK